MKKIWMAALFLSCFAGSISAAEEETVIRETGNLSYKDQKVFENEWEVTCDAPAEAKGRWCVMNAGNENGWVLRSGKVRTAASPLKHVVYRKNGKTTFFDVSGEGEKHAFRAHADFALMSAWSGPIEKVYASLAAVSPDGKQSYTAALYANGGKSIFEKNYLLVDMVDFTTGKRKNVIFKETGITLNQGKWFRLEFSMTRQGAQDRAPVILTVSLYGLKDGKRDGEKSSLLKRFSTKTMPNLGPKVQFGIVEPGTVYSVYLANIEAGAIPPDSRSEKKKHSVEHSAAAKKWIHHFMDRSNEYKTLPGSVVLAENGKAKAVIVIPEKAPAPVRYAAQELKNHLDKMTGANFLITAKEPEDGTAICLGGGGKEKLESGGLARDGYRIKASGSRILIAGVDDNTEKSEILFRYCFPESRKPDHQKNWNASLWDFERGTLYGVYRFLEMLGVRWFMPGDEIGTVIPSVKNLSVKSFLLKEEPVFDQRLTACIWNLPNLKNTPVPTEEYHKSFKALGWSGAKVQQWRLRMRCSTNWYPLNHHPPRLQYELRFGKTHPEYFALVNGKRSLASEMGEGRTGALCYSNPGLLREILKDTDAFFSGVHAKERGLLWTDTAAEGMCFNNGWPVACNYKDMISLLPHDMFHPCSCELCAPLISDRYAGELSDLVWGFVSRAAGEIRKKWPGKLVSNLAYATYSHLPYKLDSLPDNVIVGILPCFDKLNEPYTLLNPERKKQYFEFTRQWREMNRMPVSYWTHWLYRHFNPRGHYGVPMMLPGLMTEMAREQAKYGRISYMEMDTDNYLFDHLNQYFFYQAHFNPEIDSGAMMKDYAEKFYGPAGDIMYDMLRDIEIRCGKIAAADATVNEIWSREDMFNEKIIGQYRTRINEALKKTEGTVYGKRVGLMSDFFIGQMEKGLALYQKSGTSAKLRETLLKEFASRKDVDLSGGKEAGFRLMPLVGYPDFQSGDVTMSVRDNTLNLRFSAGEKELSALKRECRTNFGKVYGDDCFELMLVPPESRAYYQILVNANGNYNILHAGKKAGNLIPGKQFRLSVNASVSPEENTWNVNIGIPLNQFDEKDLKGTWKFNVFRNRRINTTMKYQASGIFLREYNFHRIDQYPTLKLQ